MVQAHPGFQHKGPLGCPAPQPCPAGLQSLYFPGLVGVASCPSRRRAQQSQRNTARPEPGCVRPRSLQVEAGSEQEQTQGHPCHHTCQSSARLAMQTAAASALHKGSGTTHSAGDGRSWHGHLHPGLQLPRSSKVPTNLHKLPQLLSRLPA